MHAKTLTVCLTLVFSAVALLPGNASAEEPECDPYPIGRCGDYNRETVTFCYVVRDGQYVSATDDSAVGIPGARQFGVESGFIQIDDGLVYLRSDPTMAFVEDPYNAPFPFQSAFQEDNNVPGLQSEPFQCGKWVWFPECVPQQWMGPTGVVSKQPDSLIV